MQEPYLVPAKYAQKALALMSELKQLSIPIPAGCRVIWFNLLDVQVPACIGPWQPGLQPVFGPATS